MFVEFTELIKVFPEGHKYWEDEKDVKFVRKKISIKLEEIIYFKENVISTTNGTVMVAETYKEIKEKIEAAQEQEYTCFIDSNGDLKKEKN